MLWLHLGIRRRSDYIIGFIARSIGPNKSKKFTRLIAPAHNLRGKVWMKKIYMASQTITVCVWSHVCCFHSNFATYIVCRCYKPCEFLGFVWTDWGNKSYYVITSTANSLGERKFIECEVMQRCVQLKCHFYSSPFCSVPCLDFNCPFWQSTFNFW